MRVPPPLLRRVLIAPLILAAELALIVAAPVLTAIAALLSPLFGGRRPIRALALALAYATGHVAAVAGCTALWAAGLRRPARAALRGPALVRRHRRADGAAGRARARDRPRVRARRSGAGRRAAARRAQHPLRRGRLAARPRPPAPPPPPAAADRDARGARHGPADRRDRQAAAEPVRRPARRRHRGRDRRHEPRPGRARRGADLPRGRQLHRSSGGCGRSSGSCIAATTRRPRGRRTMQHLSAPRPGGALAALEAAPDADVVFFAHHGFPDSMGQAWRELPHPTPIDVELWLVARGRAARGPGRADRLAVRLVEDARRVGRRKIFARAMSFRCGWRLYG